MSWNDSNSSLYVDNVAIAIKDPISFTNNNTNLYLYARNKGTTVDKYSYARIYSTKIYISDYLIRDFVPVVRKVDNIAGFYDMVSQQFFSSATVDNLIAGPIIE